MKRHQKIAMVVSSLGCGGAERAVVLLAEGFRGRSREVVVVTTTRREDFFRLPEGVERIKLDLLGARPGLGLSRPWTAAKLSHLARAPFELRRVLVEQSPSIVMSFLDQTNVVTLAATVGSGFPVVISEQNDAQRNPLAWPWRLLRRLLYPRSPLLVSVSQGVDRGFAWLPRKRRVVIHNPVQLPGDSGWTPALPRRLDSESLIAAMGRLTPQKGFDLLLVAFKNLLEKHPASTLLILGEGEGRQELRQQAEELGILNRVIMPGNVEDPFSYLRRATLFVLSSRWEGFGNAIVEAMACGAPVVSFDCPSGPAEIVEHEVNGLLVAPEDVPGLTAAMGYLLDDPSSRRKMADGALRSAQRFSLARIVDDWEEKVLTPLAW